MNERLIENAELALACCKATESEWGIKYWSGVLNALLRKYNSLN